MTDASPDWNARYQSNDTPWDSGRPSAELQRIVAELDLGPQRTLEIGCGTGTNAVYLAQHGFQVTGIDLSPVAIEQAVQKANQAHVGVDWHAADLLEGAEDAPWFVAEPYPLVFDRGVYHVLRRTDLNGLLAVLERVTTGGSLYIFLAGNANQPPMPHGPPQVKDEQICRELAPLFELVQLREFVFDGVVLDGQPALPLGWSAVMRRRLGA